jgi:hypothetical protein
MKKNKKLKVEETKKKKEGETKNEGRNRRRNKLFLKGTKIKEGTRKGRTEETNTEQKDERNK